MVMVEDHVEVDDHDHVSDNGYQYFSREMGWYSSGFLNQNA